MVIDVDLHVDPPGTHERLLDQARNRRVESVISRGRQHVVHERAASEALAVQAPFQQLGDAAVAVCRLDLDRGDLGVLVDVEAVLEAAGHVRSTVDQRFLDRVLRGVAQERVQDVPVERIGRVEEFSPFTGVVGQPLGEGLAVRPLWV